MALKTNHVDKMRQIFDQPENRRRSIDNKDNSYNSQDTNSSQDCSESDQSFTSEASTENLKGFTQAQLNRIESQNKEILEGQKQRDSRDKEILRKLDALSTQYSSSSNGRQTAVSDKPTQEVIQQKGPKPQIPKRKRVQSNSLSKASGSEASAYFEPTSAKQTRNIAQKPSPNSAGDNLISSASRNPVVKLCKLAIILPRFWSFVASASSSRKSKGNAQPCKYTAFINK